MKSKPVSEIKDESSALNCSANPRHKGIHRLRNQIISPIDNIHEISEMVLILPDFLFLVKE
jgi:hypothetical protein